jgi:hypothetical protein
MYAAGYSGAIMKITNPSMKFATHCQAYRAPTDVGTFSIRSQPVIYAAPGVPQRGNNLFRQLSRFVLFEQHESAVLPEFRPTA